MRTDETQKEIERSQARLASVFGDVLTRCPACGELIFPADTLPCKGVANCAAKLGAAS